MDPRSSRRPCRSPPRRRIRPNSNRQQPLLRSADNSKRLRHPSHPLRNPKPRQPPSWTTSDNPRARTIQLQRIHNRLPARTPRRGALKLRSHPHSTQQLCAC
jgi:hypothetical protein